MTEISTNTSGNHTGSAKAISHAELRLYGGLALGNAAQLCYKMA